MEATATARNRRRSGPRRLALLREPLLWAATAAFVGAAVGLVGASRVAAWLGGLSVSVGPPPVLVWLAAPLGELLVALSLLGVLPLLGGIPWAVRVAQLLGVPLVLLLVLPFLGTVSLGLGWIRLGAATPSGGPSALFVAFLVLGLCLPPLAVVPFSVPAFLGGRTKLGAMLLGLCVLAVPYRGPSIVGTKTPANPTVPLRDSRLSSFDFRHLAT